MGDKFTDDREWVRFKCLELAAEQNRYQSHEKTIATADKYHAYVMKESQCKLVKMEKRGKR